MTKITYYHILGVSSDATEDEITAAFRRKVKQWHPDISSHPDSEERMREINKAAEILCDPERRARYDRALSLRKPFEIRRAARPEPDGAGSAPHCWDSGKGSGVFAPFPFRIPQETVRYAVTGGTALLIFGILIITAITALPLFSGATGSAGAGTAGDIGVTPPASQQTGLIEAEGNERLSAGDYEGALSAYNAVIAQNPSLGGRELWYNRGIAQNALGRYGEAAESFDHVLAVTPEDSFALAQKGAALIGLGRFEESLQYTDRALNGDSDTAWIWNNRGIALAGIGQQKEARLAFENAGIFAGRSDSAMYRTIVLSPASLAGF